MFVIFHSFTHFFSIFLYIPVLIFLLFTNCHLPHPIPHSKQTPVATQNTQAAMARDRQLHFAMHWAPVLQWGNQDMLKDGHVEFLIIWNFGEAGGSTSLSILGAWTVFGSSFGLVDKDESWKRGMVHWRYKDYNHDKSRGGKKLVSFVPLEYLLLPYFHPGAWCGVEPHSQGSVVFPSVRHFVFFFNLHTWLIKE